MNAPEQSPDYDSPWKDILEVFFHEFILFYFPHAARGIDWERGYEFLDNELRQIAYDAEVGRRYVDKLVRLYRTDGGEEWVLVHVEIQTGRDREFAERMYVYNNRIYDKYRRRTASFALLADDVPGWRPDRFEYEIWGCEVLLRFPTAKLLDRQGEIGNQEFLGSIFGAVTAAHIRMLETRRDLPGRLRWKIAVTRSLYDLGYEQSRIKHLFRFIDWLMMLPKEINHQYYKAMATYEETVRRPFISIFEEEGMEKGLQEGIRGSLLEVLEEMYAPLPAELRSRVEAISSTDRLKRLLRSAVHTTSIEQVLRLIDEAETAG